MKKLNISLSIFFISIIICHGQNNQTIQNNIELKTPSKCSNKVENKSISLCNYISDTISYSQLKSCRKLTFNNKELSIDGNSNISIVCFYLILPIEADNSVIQFQGLDNQITEEMINKIIEAKAKKIILTEVLSWDGRTHEYLGHRTYYFE